MNSHTWLNIPKFQGLSHQSWDLSMLDAIICKCDVSISHAGVYDINRHREKIKHKENETAVNNHTLTNYFGKDDPSSNFKLSVVNAEAMMSKLTCNWNLPLTAADAFTSVFKKAFSGMFIT